MRWKRLNDVFHFIYNCRILCVKLIFISSSSLYGSKSLHFRLTFAPLLFHCFQKLGHLQNGTNHVTMSSGGQYYCFGFLLWRSCRTKQGVSKAMRKTVTFFQSIGNNTFRQLLPGATANFFASAELSHLAGGYRPPLHLRVVEFSKKHHLAQRNAVLGTDHASKMSKTVMLCFSCAEKCFSGIVSLKLVTIPLTQVWYKSIGSWRLRPRWVNLNAGPEFVALQSGSPRQRFKLTGCSVCDWRPFFLPITPQI